MLRKITLEFNVKKLLGARLSNGDRRLNEPLKFSKIEPRS